MPELSQKHHHQLRRFVRLVYEMRRSRLVFAYTTEDQTIGAGETPGGEHWAMCPVYDVEDLRSFLTLYRQVAYAKSDRPSVNLRDILDVVEQYAGPRLKQVVTEIRGTTLLFMDGRYSAFRFTKFEGDFVPVRSVTSKETLDALINGLIFHPDQKHAETIEFLEDPEVEIGMYLWPVMHEIVEPTLRGCLHLFHALRAEGLLADADYPLGCFSAPLVTTPAG